MLKEDYTVKITSRQQYEEDTGEINLDTTGTYSERAGAQFIAYREYDPDNPKLSYTSVLKVEEDKMTMMRTGTSTRLILEKGKRHLCLYDTGYGSLTVGVYTSDLHCRLDKAGGKLTVEYTLDIDSNLSSKNSLTVEIQPVGSLPMEQKG
jgi:uncharacterized beta-barrel protein YwiB (DUF1934 family)